MDRMNIFLLVYRNVVYSNFGRYVKLLTPEHEQYLLKTTPDVVLQASQSLFAVSRQVHAGMCSSL